jgi:hypothetical protein
MQVLSLSATEAAAPSCIEAIRCLTGLTSLTWSGEHVTNTLLEACLCLKKLRVLSLTPRVPASSDRITPDMFFALAKLPELSKLELTEMFGIEPSLGFQLPDEVLAAANLGRHSVGWPLIGSEHQPFGLMDEIRAVLDAERHSRGWSPLELRLMNIPFVDNSGSLFWTPVVLSWGPE